MAPGVLQTSKVIGGNAIFICKAGANLFFAQLCTRIVTECPKYT